MPGPLGHTARLRAGSSLMLTDLQRNHRRLACVSTVPQEPAVEIGRLVKRDGQTAAVDGLTLSAAGGAVTRILGANRAGETPTHEICEGSRKPHPGRARGLRLGPGRA